MKTKNIKFLIPFIKSLIALIFIFSFFIYPAFITFRVATSREFIEPKTSNYLLQWFSSVSTRFEKWSGTYLKDQHALLVSEANVAATEWPMFGSVFYLLTAEEIKDQLNHRDDLFARKTMQKLLKGSEKAAQVVADPSTAHWVENKWGKDYLYQENIFYRMLLIMGLSSYETITNKKTYRNLLTEQTNLLANELMLAPNYLLDDYPGECWPNDVLWAVAAIRRSDKMIGTDHSLLANKLMRTLNGKARTRYGLPAFKINSRTMEFTELSRGCGNSGILIFAPELDLSIAKKWYKDYEKNFYQKNTLLVGFREFPLDSPHSFSDVDSGPIISEYGTVATFFGIAAARKMGRFDQAIPMTQELLALSWPTPFGYLIPSLMSWLGTRSWVLGETAMLFSITRSSTGDSPTPNTDKTPGIVWIAFIFYASLGIYHLIKIFLFWKKYSKGNK